MKVLRTIPSNMNPWECEINGVKYSYPAGETCYVETEVAEVIDAYYKRSGGGTDVFPGILKNYGVCATAAATAAKKVTVQDEDFKLYDGVTVLVKFTNANSAGSPTLNVNDTGAKPITKISDWKAGALVQFTFDSENWLMTYYEHNEAVTHSAAGLMSAADKVKLDAIPVGGSLGPAGGIIVSDTDNEKDYLLQIKVVDGKPVAEYDEITDDEE